MAPLTGKVPGNGTSTLSYTIPTAGLDVESVYATIDTTGAAGAVTAELTIADQSGAVIARKVQNTTIDQGVAGSATWALQLLDDCVGVTPSLPFPQLVVGLKPLGDLRAYWRLGDAASPWLDSSGWSGGPTNLTASGSGSAPTNHITGALPAAEDDGAVQINGGPGTGQYLVGASSAVNTGINSSWTIQAFVKPSASASTWTGAVYNNTSFTGGDPHTLSGWIMAGVWSGGNTYTYLQRWENGTAVSINTPVTTGVWTLMHGTYDGSTLKLYANGLQVATGSDNRADLFNPYLNVTLGTTFGNPLTTVGSYLGGLDEVAIWGVVLTASEIDSLYVASQA